ncbi:NUDIX hydrolase [Streptomyces sulphureus]|uniref:NUDIX hydrolase n=1 Tax=Streptomyces sulphureus TaxID=47758 RepID=UPI00035E13EA|nr:NUDIX domain-containing protein [Streptomyces sulphureus]
MATGALLDVVRGHRAEDAAEEKALARARELAAEAAPWSRATPLHFTASALVVAPRSGRVLLRWHQRQQQWLQVGGHADPGEELPLDIALREAAEETGLPDLAPWPDAALLHLVRVPVAPGRDEPAHEHLDLRFVLATRVPEQVRAEHPEAPLRWLEFTEARRLTGAANVRASLDRAERLLGAGG